jgi:hypothetical protein
MTDSPCLRRTTYLNESFESTTISQDDDLNVDSNVFQVDSYEHAMDSILQGESIKFDRNPTIDYFKNEFAVPGGGWETLSGIHLLWW